VSTEAGYNTMLSVSAKDGTVRDVAICAGDTPEQIGEAVIAAIHGKRTFQLSTKWVRWVPDRIPCAGPDGRIKWVPNTEKETT
jgi:hypothetical protein